MDRTLSSPTCHLQKRATPGDLKLPHKSSGFIKILVAVLIIVAGVAWLGWAAWKESPQYAANQNLKLADEHAENYQIGKAIKLLVEVKNSGTKYASEAPPKARNLTSETHFSNAPGQEITDYLVIVLEHKWVTFAKLDEHATPEITKRETTDPLAAYRMLKTLYPHAPNPEVLDEQRIRLLKAAYEKHPLDVPTVIDIAVYFEQQNDFDAAVKALESVKTQLGDSEGARILGQVYSAEGKYEEAYPLLLAYTQSRMNEYREAEAAYDKSLNDVWDVTIEFLNSGNAGQDFYNAYDAASDEEKNNLVNEEYAKRRDKSAQVEAAYLRYRQSSSVVPVALDMGIVMLRRAQSMSDPEQRNRELTAAENMFLAVKGSAGESDTYRFYLAQVYYWLGKPDDGKNLFDELIAKYNRDYSTLNTVAGLLRELGSHDESKALYEEAYDKAGSDEERYYIAISLASMLTGSDEGIEWLKKSDPNDPQVQADLNQAEALEAYNNGDTKTAEMLYVKAAEAYEKLSKTAAHLNNRALIYFALYDTTKNQDYFTKGANTIDEALELAPSDTIALDNAAGEYLRYAYRSLCDKHLNTSKVEGNPGWDCVYYLYNDATEKAVIAKELSADEYMQKALAHYEKVNILSPKSKSVYNTLSDYFFLLEDGNSLSQLLDRLEKAKIDVEPSSDFGAYLGGEFDETYAEAYQQTVDFYQDQLGNIKDVSPRLEAYLLGEIADALLDQSRFLPEPDFKMILDKAELAYQAQASSSTRRIYETALIALAAEELSQSNALIGRFLKDNKILSYEEIVLVALDFGTEEEVKSIVSNKHVIEFASISNRGISNFPASVSVREALFMSLTGLGANHKNAALAESSLDTYIRIHRQFNANEETKVYDDYWNSRLRDGKEKAREILLSSKKKGHLLPYPALDSL